VNIRVKSIFDYSYPKKLLEDNSQSAIIAIPVNKKVARSIDILLAMIKI